MANNDVKGISKASSSNMLALLEKKETEILRVWMEQQLANVTLRLDLMSKEDLEKQSQEFLRAFVKATSTGNLEDIEAPEYRPVIEVLEGISRSCAAQGFTPSETVIYVFSLKDTILQFSQEEFGDQPEVLNRETIIISKLLDKLGLVTFETYAKGREEVIVKQTAIMAEIATPVMILWKEILLLPIVGTLDSKRAQDIMENMLAKIQTEESKLIILDILGVPTVDSAVANHLIKITKATKLMGCDCVVTGISPSVAQSLVHLGIDLGDVLTRASLKDGLEYAYGLLNLEVVKIED